MPPDFAQENYPPIDEHDRQAARRALARNWPHLDQNSDKYRALLDALATFHGMFGTDSFELRYNLRPPANRAEEWQRQYMHGELTEEQLRDRLKADAERPIDLEMLTSFCDAYQQNLEYYSEILQNAVPIPHKAEPADREQQEQSIDRWVDKLEAKLPLWRENLETVFEYLEETQVASGRGLVKIGDFEGTSAHWVAQLIFSKTKEGWQCCKEIAKRSSTDPRYLYAARAVDLFFQQWFPTLPLPQTINERLREEFVRARMSLKSRTPTAGSPMHTAGNVAADDESNIDNECREAILLGEMHTLVGKAGHIFRPTMYSDWGIDGEIEFKNKAGEASGQRVYVQLKSGDSHLVRRKSDGVEVFSVKKVRHLEYWRSQAYPVMLVIRQADGLIRWMDVSNHLRTNSTNDRQIVFQSENVTPESIRLLGTRLLNMTGRPISTLGRSDSV